MGGSSGGGGQSAAAAAAAEHQAKMAKLQSATIRTNIGTAKSQISSGLLQFDDLSLQQQASTALMLARSGAMSARASESFATRDELGISFDLVDPLASIRDDIARSDPLINADAELNALRNELNNITGTTVYEDEEYTETVGGDTRWVDAPEDRNKDDGPTVRVRTKTKKREVTRTRQVERIVYSEEEEARRTELATQIAEKEVEVESLKETILGEDQTMEDLVNEREYFNKQLDMMQQVVDDVQAESGDGVSNLQQLQYTRGSTFSATSKALQMLKDQRASMFNEAIGGVLSMTQDMMNADEQAAISEQQARDYTRMANIQEHNMMLQTIFQGAGLAVGIAAAPWTGGTSIAAGSAAGSFLGNAFSRGY